MMSILKYEKKKNEENAQGALKPYIFSTVPLGVARNIRK